MSAAKHARPDLVKLPLEAKADPHRAAADGTTALMLGAGGDPLSPSMPAAERRAAFEAGPRRVLEVVSLLLAAGAPAGAARANGRTALHDAAAGGYDNPALVKLLLASGADLAARTKIGRTPLLEAAASDHLGALASFPTDAESDLRPTG
jgi:ankyrin repeat protein